MKKKKIFLGIVGIALSFMTLALIPGPVAIHKMSRVIDAPSSKVWKVVSDVDGYEKYATGLHDAQIISGSGKGMIRSCSNNVGGWTEKCTNWVEGKTYSFVVDTKKSDYPYPFKHIQGSWEVEGLSDEVSNVIVTFEYQFGRRWMHWLFNGATLAAFDEGNTALLDNYQKEIEKDL